MCFAPIVIFAFKRPEHLKQTLDALAENDEAKYSDLFIYCDGAKPNVGNDVLEKVDQVISISKSENRFKNVEVIVRKTNFGLSKSVISGVTEIIKKHGNIIVLEDDIFVSKNFLKFINQGLKLYKNDAKVYGVTGYCFPSAKNIKQDTFFLPIMSSWGYATWVDRWDKINFNGFELLKEVKRKKLEEEINFGQLNYLKMLQDQVEGRNDSWAVRFYVSMFLKQGVFLYPNKTLLLNIGLDGSGFHCLPQNNVNSTTFDISTDISLNKTEITLNPKILKAFKQGHRKKKDMVIQSVKKKIKRALAPEFIDFIKRKVHNKHNKELNRLLKLPRFSQTQTVLLNKTITLPDGASYVFMQNEIFNENIYEFKTNNQEPYIIDAGANIGLSVIYFKKKFPNAKVVAFEPDPEIFNILKNNMQSFNLKDVDLINKGVWKEDATLPFFSEGADAGTLNVKSKNKENLQTIDLIALKPYISKKVDFLKIDIEGAETEVLKSVENSLHHVARIFIEYHSYVGEKQTLGEIINILERNNFRFYISAGLSSKSPFVNINTYANMDMQLNIHGIKNN